MALTIAVTRRIVAGHQNIVSGTIAFDSSYSTGGVSLTPAMLGLRVVDLMLFQQNTLGFTFSYDYTNSKAQVYTQGAAHAAAGAATLDDYAVTAGPGVSSGISISREAGAGAVTSAWGPLKEVAASNDLSTVTGVRFIAFGV